MTVSKQKRVEGGENEIFDHEMVPAKKLHNFYYFSSSSGSSAFMTKFRGQFAVCRRSHPTACHSPTPPSDPLATSICCLLKESTHSGYFRISLSESDSACLFRGHDVFEAGPCYSRGWASFLSKDVLQCSNLMDIFLVSTFCLLGLILTRVWNPGMF